MIVIACGGRDYANRAAMCACLDAAHEAEPFRLLIEGGANGADRLAREWALSRGVHVATVWALWNAHGNAAEPRRNAEQLEIALSLAGADTRLVRLVAAPGGVETADMVRKAKVAGVRVVPV